MNSETFDALAAIQRVAYAMTAPGTLPQLAAAALSEMRESLALEVAAMYLADDEGDPGGEPSHEPMLREFAVSAPDGATAHVLSTLVLNAEAWRLLSAARGPLVFGAGAGWLLADPFEAGMDSWLILPLHSEGAIVGAVVGGAARPIAVDPTAVMALSALGNLLSAGIATARLRMEVRRTAVQRERMRLAAELHDGLAQDLALAMRELSFLEGDPAGENAPASWERLRGALHSAHRVVRAGLEDLSAVVPVTGLQGAVEELCDRFRQRGLTISVDVVEPDVDVAPQIFSTVLRVVQEALANVQRHAGARVDSSVRLGTADGVLRLEIVDNGPGIEQPILAPGDGHFGIWIMRERAGSVGGTLRVARGSAGGTAVTLTIPVGRPEGHG